MATALQDKDGLHALYETDFYAWARLQAETLRKLQTARPNLPLDFEHLIEEVEDLARSDLRTARSQVRRIIEHLLKLEFSPADRPRHQWRRSFRDARNQLGDVLTASLQQALVPNLPGLYTDARAIAADDLRDHDEREAVVAMPEALPYSLDQLIDKAWYPTNRHGLAEEAY